MSEMAKKARAAMKEKAQGRAAPTKGSIDASGWSEPTMNTAAKVGMRPISRRQFKKGGKVEGEKAMHHAGKRPRKAAGGEMDWTNMARAKEMAFGNAMANAARSQQAGGSEQVPAAFQDRDRLQRMNQLAGNMKRGGRSKKAAGGSSDFAAMAEAGKDAAREAKMRRIINEANAPMPMPRRDRSTDYLPTDRPFAPEKRGGRTGRKNGGKAPLTADSLINRDVKEANEERGYPHTGGYKKGGMAYAKGGKANDKKWDEDKEKWVKKKPSDGDGQGTATRDSFEGPNLGQGYKRGGYAGGGYKKGGKVHEDAAMDKKLIKAEMAKHAKGCTCKACGGRMGKEGGGSAMDYLSPAAMAMKNPKMLSPLAMAMGKKKGGSAGNYEGGTRPTGGRIARKSGGRAKGKTNIHINIIAGEKHPEGMAPPMGIPGPLPRPPMPVAPPPMAGGAGMPPMGPPPAPMGGGLPPGLGVPPPAMGPMARKAGGRVGHRGYSSYKDMDAGAGGGLGRLEKTEIQKKKG